jgi:hypothetical protein
VDLRELVLGNVARGITEVVDGAAKSKHLLVLNLYSFVGHDRATLYNIDNVLEKMMKLYRSQSVSLQRLVVSRTTISEHQAEPMLANLEAAAGGRLKVERRD